MKKVVTKESLRVQMRRRRKMLGVQQRTSASRDVCNRLIQSPLFQNSKKIACYFSKESECEVDTSSIIERIHNAGKRCYLPLLDHSKKSSLCFIHYDRGDPLKPNRYSIPEPIFLKERVINSEELDLILLPLVAFDSDGNRLGMGAGYYDSTCAHLKGNAIGKPLLVGLAYDFQHIMGLPTDPWDVSLDGVVTETEISLFGTQK